MSDNAAITTCLFIVCAALVVAGVLGKGCNQSDNETRAKIIGACLQAGRPGDECKRAAAQ